MFVGKTILHSKHGPDREEGLPYHLPDHAQGEQHPTEKHQWNPRGVPCDHGKQGYLCKIVDSTFYPRTAVRKKWRKAWKMFGQLEERMSLVGLMPGY